MSRPSSTSRLDTLQQQLTAETNGGPDILEPVEAVVEQVKEAQPRCFALGLPVDWKDKDSSLAAAEIIVSGEETRLTTLIAGSSEIR